MHNPIKIHQKGEELEMVSRDGFSEFEHIGTEAKLAETLLEDAHGGEKIGKKDKRRKADQKWRGGRGIQGEAGGVGGVWGECLSPDEMRGEEV